MTCGIYLLKFTGTDKVYVGQSVNIEYRYKKHIQSLKRGSSNCKLQQAFKEFGTPELSILVETGKKDLNDCENEAIQIFNSVDYGFNIAEYADIHSEGEDNPASKYSNKQVYEVFLLLLDLSYRYKDIEDITGVPISTIRHIANCEAHTWLRDQYPEEYKILESYRGKLRQQATNSAKQKGIEYPAILSPKREVFVVNNVSAFAKEHDLDASALSKVLNKRPKYITHKGWKLA
jgi:group I intron endonuclease